MHFSHSRFVFAARIAFDTGVSWKHAISRFFQVMGLKRGDGETSSLLPPHFCSQPDQPVVMKIKDGDVRMACVLVSPACFFFFTLRKGMAVRNRVPNGDTEG